MTEDDAREWVRARWGEARAELLDRFGRFVIAENDRQNLISASTSTSIWTRHLLDSAQLLRFADDPKRWLDVGTGAGFPGMVVAAILPATQVTLVEPRRRRVEFLEQAVRELELTNVAVALSTVEKIPSYKYDVISARAVMPAGDLLRATSHVRDTSTTYILPRGRNGAEEIATLRREWQGMFHVEHSLTDPTSTIIVASGVA